MDYKKIILSHVIDYLRIKKYPHESYGKIINLQCCFCKNKSLTAQVIAHTHKIKCLNEDCKREGKSFTLISIVRYAEKDKRKWDAEKIIQYLKKLFKIKVLTPEDKERILKLFNRYKEEGFCLTCDKKDSKKGIEEAWTKKEHREINQWMEWIAMGLNVSIKTGQCSNLTVIDLDGKIPKEIKKLLENTWIHKGNRGYHCLFRYVKDLLKGAVKDYKMEVLGDGDKFTVAPSIVEGVARKFINNKEIAEMPEELIKWLKKHLEKKFIKKDISEKIKEDIETESYCKPLIAEGEGRNELFIRLGGMFRKFLNKEQVKKALRKLDKVICDPPLSDNDELENTVFGSIDKYTYLEDEEMATQILDYLKETENAERRDVERSIIGNYKEGEQKARFDRTIASLLREELIQRRGRYLQFVKKLEWKTDLLDGTKSLNFKVPYFDDIMYFGDGDVIIIGALPGTGKTHIAMNIVKQIINQKKGIIPKYISLEGRRSRFKKVALQIGLAEGEFEWDYCRDPTKVELDDNAITIIDWLMPNQYKDTDKIIGHFNDQLDKHGGFLIIFVQLKDNGEWFAKNLINFFPAFSCKYFYDDKDGTTGHFGICKVRESQRKKRIGKIPCTFNWETKILSRIDKIKEVKVKEEKEQEFEDEKEEKISAKKRKKMVKVYKKKENKMSHDRNKGKKNKGKNQRKKTKSKKRNKKLKSYYEE